MALFYWTPLKKAIGLVVDKLREIRRIHPMRKPWSLMTWPGSATNPGDRSRRFEVPVPRFWASTGRPSHSGQTENVKKPPVLTQSLLLKIGFFWILFRCCSQLFRIFKWMRMSSHNSNPHLHCKWEKSSNAPTSNVDFGNRPERNTSFGAPAALPRPLFLVTGPGRVEWVEIRFLMFFSSWS